MAVSTRAVAMFCLALALASPSPAQTVRDDDGTTLKQIIIYGRHSVRSSVLKPEDLDVFAAHPYPDFKVKAGALTARGWQAEKLLGAYFRHYLRDEGLLTDNVQEDVAQAYFRANSIERSQYTAAAFQTGVLPDVESSLVHSFQGNTDPLFDPIGGGVVTTVDTGRALAEVKGVFGDGQAIPSAYSGEDSLIRSVLFDYPYGTLPLPPTPKDKIDVTALPIEFTANTAEKLVTGNVINLGGLSAIGAACDPFIMQYTDNFPLEKVGWGRFTPETLSQQTRFVNLGFAINLRTPYLAQLQSSNAASHVLRSMKQVVSGGKVRGAFRGAKARLNVIISSDTYVAALAGLLGVHWQLPGYQPDFCSPGGALVFELRQSDKTREYFVRVFYTSQTLDQLRDLTPLSRENPPATMQLLVPGGSASSTNLDVKFSVFQKLLKHAIGRKYVQKPSQELQPGVIPMPTPPEE